MLERARARALGNPYWQFLGVEVEAAGEGWIRLRLPVREELRNGAKALVHGGALASLLDAAIGGALSTLLQMNTTGIGQATIDLNISYISAAREGNLIAEGRIIKRGARIAFGEADIRNDAGELLARGRATFMILRPRP